MNSAQCLASISVCLFISTHGYKSSDQICPNSWVDFGDSCYRIIKQSVSWSQAEETCRAWKRGHLASITSLEEQHFVKSLATNEGVRVPIWIGFRKSKYQWVDGSEVLYEDWNSNQPRSYTSPTAYVFLSRSGRWKWYDVQYASHQYLPLCKMPLPATGRCPDASYWTWSNFCYRLQPVMKSFGESELLCRTQGSHLASIHSAAEMTFLRSQLSKHASNNIWIGLKLTSKPFEFEWTDECVSGANYSSWRTSSTSSPDVPHVGSVCAKLDNTQRWKWSVVGCHKGGTAFYMCESAMFSPTSLEESCSSQTKNITDEPAEEKDGSEISGKSATQEQAKTESLIGNMSCAKQYESSQLIIVLVCTILVMETLLVFILLGAICYFRKRLTLNKKIDNTRPSVVFRRPTEKDVDVQVPKGTNQITYKHMNPENRSDPDAAKENVENNNPVSPGGHPRRMGVSVLPNVPKCNEYTEYKVPSYMNEVNTKDEENYLEIDEYEELPLRDCAEDYELPKE